MVPLMDTLTESLTTKLTPTWKTDTRQILIELSKEACSKCNVLSEEICFNCKVHKLINQLLRKMT